MNKILIFSVLKLHLNSTCILCQYLVIPQLNDILESSGKPFKKQVCPDVSHRHLRRILREEIYILKKLPNYFEIAPSILKLTLSGKSKVFLLKYIFSEN